MAQRRNLINRSSRRSFARRLTLGLGPCKLITENLLRLEDESPEDLIDPDPFSTLLIILGALGSVASLYALIDPRVTAARAEREANRYAVRDCLMGAETALNELRGYIRSLQIAFSVGTQTRNHADAMMSIAQFGGVQLLFAREGHERWREIEEGIVATVSRIQRHMSDLMRHFAVNNHRLQPDTARRLQYAIEKLNEIVRSLNQTHFERLFGMLEVSAGECMDVLSQIRQDNGTFLR